jgi:isocitrate/isopropylmalate dehydrogenase
MKVIAEGKHVTYDLGGNSGTREMAEAIVRLL